MTLPPPHSVIASLVYIRRATADDITARSKPILSCVAMSQPSATYSHSNNDKNVVVDHLDRAGF